MPHQQPRGMCPAQVCRKPKLNHQNTPKPTGRMTEEVAKGLPAWVCRVLPRCWSLARPSSQHTPCPSSEAEHGGLAVVLGEPAGAQLSAAAVPMLL